MSTTTELKTTHWHGCYKGGWGPDEVTPEAFSHPAKFARNLIIRIYEHMLERGYIRPGDTVVDPFAGVCLGAPVAMLHGLHWYGVELEQPFVDIGGGCDCTGFTKAEWRRLYGRADRMRYRDGRHLCPRCVNELNAKPGNSATGHTWPARQKRRIRMRQLAASLKARGITRQPRLYDDVPLPSGETYRPPAQQMSMFGLGGRSGKSVGNSGRIPHVRPHRYQGNIERWQALGLPGTARVVQGDSRRLLAVLGAADCAVGSPPYADAVNAHGEGPGMAGNEYQRKRIYEGNNNEIAARSRGVGYGRSPGQLGAMPEGDVDAAISSPPYSDAVDGSGEGPGARHDFVHHAPDNATKRSSANGYGRTPGNLGNMPGYDAAVSSSPFTGTHASEQSEEFYRARGKTGKTTGTVGQEYAEKIPYEKRGFLMGKEEYKRWSQSCNLGSITTSQETFWGEARVILEQTFAALKPGGVAAWVTGNFRRNGQIVDFGSQWLALCEAVGFVGLECITAWKVEPGPTQFGMFVEDRDLTIERTSFFRRLDNQRNPDAPINSEQVWIVQKPGASK